MRYPVAEAFSFRYILIIIYFFHSIPLGLNGIIIVEMIMKFNRTFKLILYFLIYLGLSFAVFYFDLNRFYLVINCGLSMFAFVLSEVGLSFKRSAILVLLVTLPAIFFYPNCIYMATDFIHTRTSEFYSIDAQRNVNYVMEFIPWLKMMVDVLFITLSLLLSYETFVNILEIIKVKGHVFAEFIMLIFFSGISGVAVYLGRFVRFNSWDVVSPSNLRLIYSTLSNLKYNDYLLIGVFAAFHLAIIILLSIFKRQSN